MRRGLLVLALVVLVAAPAGATRPDTLFPGLGVAGLDVVSYDVVLTDNPVTNHIDAVARLTAEVARPTTRIDLDLEGLTVRSVTVNGSSATYSRHGTRLEITPADPVDGRFTMAVAYRGTPRQHTDADGSAEGWVRTDDGSVALGEPVGAMDWLPCDDTPGDKATFTVDVTVPKGYEVAGNGSLVGRTTTAATDRFVWHAPEPMAAYLATVAIGHYDETDSTYTSIDGRTIGLHSFVDPDVDQQLARSAGRALPGVLRFEEERFGPYPFATSGFIDDASSVGYSLETQTRPFFDGTPDIDTEVHELAHQWFGDSLTLTDWHDIWLAEGFATYAEWLWDAAHGGPTTQQRFDQLYATPAGDPLWHPSPRGFTDPADLFGAPSYNRGAMTLQALRVRIGDAAFFRLLRAWPREHRHGSVHTAQLETLAEHLSDRDLAEFFHAWLDRTGKPAR